MSSEEKISQDESMIKMQQLYPRPKFIRLLMKAPLVLWRLGLGSLSGFILLILTTRGRKSGLPRRAVIEYHRLDGLKYAVSAFGERADWYRNILANPLITVQSSDGEERVKVERVRDDAELKKVFQLFIHRDAPLTVWYLKSLGIKPDAADVIKHKDRLHFLRFEPVESETLPGLEKDLLWVWPLLLLSFFLAKLLRDRTKKLFWNCRDKG